MRAYICDSCGAVIRDPYRETMREYVYHSKSRTEGRWKREVHLCAYCYQNLRHLAENTEARDAD